MAEPLEGLDEIAEDAITLFRETKRAINITLVSVKAI